MEAVSTESRTHTHPILMRFLHIRKRSVELCSALKTEDFVCQPVAWVSPPKWHLAHTTWFFEAFILTRFLPDYQLFHKDYNFLFNSYYETIGERVQRNHRGMLFRPPLEDIFAYRRYVEEHMAHLLKENADPLVSELVELGLQHEQQHQELLITDTKYIFAQNPLLPVWDAKATLETFRQPAALQWLSVEEGVYEIGYEGTGFCFDNEWGRHKQYLRNFSIMNRPVTNGEYLEFLEAGGYQNFRYWLSEGWEWVKENDIVHPMYWYKIEEQWWSYHLDGLKPLDPALPLMHISYFEADAYARWKGQRLPTEFEWETAARLYPACFKNEVWEWTQSAYLAYPGFRIAEGATGEYNGKFMINQMVLRGGSLATAPGHSRVSYRNFFHPHLQWQFSGVRLVNDA